MATKEAKVIDLAPTQDGSHALTVHQPAALDYGTIQRMGADLSKSGFFKNYTRAEQAAAIILAGQELGLPPMTALRSIVMVEGKVSLSSELMLALMQRAGVRVRWTRTDTTAAEIEITRPGEQAQRLTFTIEDAQRAGVAGKNVWKSYPAAMLRARAVSAAVRAFCPDILLGVYVHGEIEDAMDAPPPKPVTPTPPADEGHHESWAADRPRFHAKLRELLPELKDPYEAVKAFTVEKRADNRKPSQLAQKVRDGLIGKLETDEGKESFWTWVNDQGLDAFELRPLDAPDSAPGDDEPPAAVSPDDDIPL